MDFKLQFIKRHGGNVFHDHFYLIAEPHSPFKWKGVYQNKVLVSASLKRGWLKIHHDDIYVDQLFLRESGITLLDDKESIASRINDMLKNSML